MWKLKALIHLSMSGLRRIKYYIIANTIAFIIGIIVGILHWSTIGEKLSKELYGITKELSINPFYAYTYILGHNLIIAIPLGFLLGVTIIVPTMVALINGAGISAIVMYIQEKLGIPAILSVYAMLPHGIFEVPAFIIATSCGIDFGVSTWKRLLNRIPSNEYRIRLREELTLLLISVILFIIAAAIETSLIILTSTLK